MNFTNKVILITGASSGIGTGSAEYFAKYNANLALTGRNANKLNEVVRKCRTLSSTGQNKIISIVADIDVDAEKIIRKTIDYFGKLDILVNNAGILEVGSIETASMEQFDKLMRTNVRAVFELTKFAVPYLLTSKGNIVNVSSVAGLRSFQNVTVYCMSKATLDQFTRCLSLDLAAKGVRVNSVNPGLIKTELHVRSGMNEEQYAQFTHHQNTITPLGRAGTINEVAELIGFLACDEHSGFMTGACLPIDGGKGNVCPR